MSAPVTIIGLGNLGQALCRQFLSNGHPTTVWNRSAAKAESLVANGAVRADTVAEAVAASELVIVGVLDQAAAKDVLATAAEAVSGRVVVNVTSGTPETARELAAWAAEHGAEYLAGAVYAVPQTIGTEEAWINYSGSAKAFETWQKQLDLLGRGTFLGADPGLASEYDLAILAGMYGLLGGFFQAAAMADAAGIKAAALTPMLSSWLTGSLAALPEFAREIDNRDYATEMSNLDMNRAGLATIINASESRGVSAAILTPLKAAIDRQIADGHEADSLSRAFETLRTPA